jgi:formamidopyrimidine-DNA glycosylase
MPELAEVAYASTRWKTGINLRIQEVIVHPKSRVFRELERSSFIEELSGTILRTSQSHGKQMLFGFSSHRWLGLHLGMTGWLHSESKSYSPAKHDALVLTQSKQKLVFRDPRQFGRLRLHIGKELPAWWTEQPISMLNPSFDKKIIQDALVRHKKRPIKALLLDQRYFPGMGNWMADEVLWRACIHPLTEVDKSKSLYVILFSKRLYLSPAERCNQSAYTEETHQKAGYFIIDGKMEGIARNLKTFWSGNRLAAGRVAGLPPVSPWSSQIIFCLFAIFMNLIL